MSYNNLLNKYKNHPEVRNFYNYRLNLGNSPKLNKNAARVGTNSLRKKILYDALRSYTNSNSNNAYMRKLKSSLGRMGKLNTFNNLFSSYRE